MQTGSFPKDKWVLGGVLEPPQSKAFPAQTWLVPMASPGDVIDLESDEEDWSF